MLPFQGSYAAWVQDKARRVENEQAADSRHLAMLRKEQEWMQSNQKARSAQRKARLKRIETLEHEVSDKHIETGQLMIPAGPRLGSEVLQAENITKGFDGHTLIEDFSFKLQRGWTVGIVGPNGVGKSTLVRLLMGEEEVDSGRLSWGSTVRVGHLGQSRQSLHDENSVYKEVTMGQEHITVGGRVMNGRSYVAQFNFRVSMVSIWVLHPPSTHTHTHANNHAHRKQPCTDRPCWSVIRYLSARLECFLPRISALSEAGSVAKITSTIQTKKLTGGHPGEEDRHAQWG